MILRSKVTNESATEYYQRVHAIDFFFHFVPRKKGIGISFLFPLEMEKRSASLAISLILPSEKGKKNASF